MVTFPYEFDLQNVIKSEWVPVGSCAAPKMIGNVVDKKAVSSRTPNPSSGGILKSTTSSMTGMSRVNPGVGSTSSTIPIDLTNVSPNLRTCLESIMGKDLRPE